MVTILVSLCGHAAESNALSCRVPFLYQRPETENLSLNRCLQGDDRPSSMKEPLSQPLDRAVSTLKSAGPSIAPDVVARLKLERSGPSGNLSKLYNMKVRAFAPAKTEGDA